MGINGGHCHVDDFKALGRILVLEEDLQNAREAEGGFGIAHGGGFAKDKNPVGVRRLFCSKQRWLWRAGESGREKAARKFLIFYEDAFAIDFRAQKKVRRIAVAE